MKKLEQVLIIDDDEVNNLFCKIVIEHLGISGEVFYCMNGAEGLDYLSSCISSHTVAPDLILLDLNMPRMDGLQFLRYYHELGYHVVLPTKISLLSSSGREAETNTALKYGCVIDYITKPLSEDALNRLLYKLT